MRTVRTSCCGVGQRCSPCCAVLRSTPPSWWYSTSPLTRFLASSTLPHFAVGNVVHWLTVCLLVIQDRPSSLHDSNTHHLEPEECACPTPTTSTSIRCSHPQRFSARRARLLSPSLTAAISNRCRSTLMRRRGCLTTRLMVRANFDLI